MDLIVTDATGKPVASHASYTLDLAFGSGENDFDLQVEDAALKAGSRIMIDGTEYGGIIDDTDVDVDGGLSTVTWHGRDWHGVLASKIIEPDGNNDYLTLSGTIPVIMRTLVSRAGLQGLFAVTDESADHKTTCQFDRYVDLYSGLVKMLRASGLKLRLRNDGDKVSMSAMPVRTIGDSIDSDLIDFTAKQAAHPINHLICLGKGELKDRTVIHWYADANGTFSHTQTLKGLDERTATYELSNAEADELEDKGRQKFQELRNTSTIDVDIPDGIDADVGDLVTGRDNNTGLVVTAEISKKIVKVSGGVLTVTYESGGASAGGNSGESSIGDGGHAYYAGAGLKLDAWTFSADVTRNDIDALNNALSGKQPKGDYITGLKIGSVDTLAPGAQASASLTGAGSDKTLNLGLPKGDQGPQGRRATRATQDHRGPPERPDPPVLGERKERPGSEGRKASPVPKARRDCRGYAARKAIRVMPARSARRDRKARRVPQVRRVPRVHRERPAPRADKASKVPKASRARKGRRVTRATAAYPPLERLLHAQHGRRRRPVRELSGQHEPTLVRLGLREREPVRGHPGKVTHGATIDRQHQRPQR